MGPLPLPVPQHLPLPSTPPPPRPASHPPTPPPTATTSTSTSHTSLFNNYNMPSNWTLVHRTKTDQCDLFYAPSYLVQHSIYLKTNLFCTHTCSLNVTSHTVNNVICRTSIYKKTTHWSCIPFIVQAASPTLPYLQLYPITSLSTPSQPLTS